MENNRTEQGKRQDMLRRLTRLHDMVVAMERNARLYKNAWFTSEVAKRRQAYQDLLAELRAP